MKEPWMKTTAATLIISMASLSLPIQAFAAVIPTDAVIAQATAMDLSHQRTELTTFLTRTDVQKQLVSLGVDQNQAAARIAALSDAEVQQLYGKMQTLPAGGDILGTLVFIFVLLLITDLLGLTNVYPFVHHR
ncbi:MAG: PA2779 family protein [Moraxellaceae bacterium]|nr:PA2779 family protein [Moraxellaceae bacterium]